MWDEQEAFRAYAAYGADLIRTGGLLAGATPSVIFRATVLFQRFEKVVNNMFRVNYLTQEEMARLRASQQQRRNLLNARSDSSFYPSSGSSSSDAESDDGAESVHEDNKGDGDTHRVEYIIPAHAATEMPSGQLPLIDLLSPLDYCVHNIIAHEDISFLTAACLLVAAKLEQPQVTVRVLTAVFMRLGLRRCGMPVPEELLQVTTSNSNSRSTGGQAPSVHPPDEKYDDFKVNIIRAEELVLHLLGFQTFVNSPYKYVQVFLSLIVESPSTSPAYVHWLQHAVSWLNDAPRSPALASAPAASLAAFAIHSSLPPNVVLPPGWFTGLGVTEASFEEVRGTYDACCQEWTESSSEALSRIRACMPKPQYLTLAQWEALEVSLCSSSSSSSSSLSGSAQSSREPSIQAGDGRNTAAPNEVPQSGAAIMPIAPAESSEPGDAQSPPPLPVSSPTGLEELEKREFVDIREIQRRRRLEAKERDEAIAAERGKPAAGTAPTSHSRRKRSRSREKRHGSTSHRGARDHGKSRRHENDRDFHHRRPK